MRFEYIYTLPPTALIITRDYIIKQNWVGRYKIPLVSLLVMAFCVFFLPLSWDFIWLEIPQVLCMLSQLLKVHVCNCCAVSEKTLLLLVIHHLRVLSFCPFLNEDTWAFVEGVWNLFPIYGSEVFFFYKLINWVSLSSWVCIFRRFSDESLYLSLIYIDIIYIIHIYESPISKHIYIYIHINLSVSMYQLFIFYLNIYWPMVLK